MGTAHKVVSVVLRGIELASAIIILGLLGRFFRLLDLISGPNNSRLEYAISMAAISVAVSILLMPPMEYSFYCFPLDFALFVFWIVCFALLEDLTGTHTCSSTWFNTYWATYWSPASGNTVVVASSGCSTWRTVLAFSFIIAFVFFISGLLVRTVPSSDSSSRACSYAAPGLLCLRRIPQSGLAFRLFGRVSTVHPAISHGFLTYCEQMHVVEEAERGRSRKARTTD
ncbi:hypothetical protein GE09DRAFT_69811 [Coniochaeta sp. 2T2.1]|nr:hypothetical protein GE09DRAFT_69811 [Coniochaeta sp. 2T2.1]